MSENVEFEDGLLEEMLGDFLDESDEILVQLNENLLKLDDWVQSLDEGQVARCDEDLMNEMFRGAHSLKGVSGVLRLDDINALTHKIENIFDAARNDQLALNGHIVEVIFQSVDKLSHMIDCLKDPDAEEVDCATVLSDIKEILESGGVERKQMSTSDAEQVFLDAQEEISASDETPSSTEVESIDHFADIVDETEISVRYLGFFIDETEDAMDEISDLLLADSSIESSQSLMIQCHKIKGSAASLGLQRAAKLAHFMEDLLQELLQDERNLTSDMTEAMLLCIDTLRRYVDELKAGTTPNTDFNEVYSLLLASRGMTNNQEESPPSNEATRGETPSETGLSAEQREQIEALAPLTDTCFLVQITLEPDTPLPGLKANMAHGRIANLGSVFYCDPPETGLEDLPEVSHLTLAVTTDSDPEAIREKLRLSGIASLEIDPLNVPEPSVESVQPPAVKSESAPGPTEQSAKDTAPTDPSPEATSVSKPSDEVSSPASNNAPSKDATASSEKSKNGNTPPAEAQKKPTETVRVDIERLDHLMNLVGQLVINKARFSQIGDGLKTLTTNKQANQSLSSVVGIVDRLSRDLEEKDASRTPIDLDTVHSQTRKIRLDLEHIEREMKQLSEARILINDLTEMVHQLDRVTDGIQKTVMDTRMVPIGPLFRRFNRVIRDITKGNGKDIQLITRGENTELDKRMIDELGDPLIHMVRNSADHGIESPEEREAAGKPRQGEVTLDAFHRGNSILIEIRDDGKGLDVEKIRAKAIRKGIVSAADAEKMTPHQVFQLIWEPGLSTAEQVTEVSGRGMGMDIVRTKIEEINGTVELDSKIGVGTTITIKLPLTLAILPSLLVEIDGDVIAMPVETVSEIVRVNEDDLATVHGLPTATIRGRVISVVDLGQLFSWNQPAKPHTVGEDEEKSLVVIGSNGVEVGLIVNRLLGEEDVVIKSMAENFRNVEGIAGASILGDGRVSLILDIGAVLEMSAHQDETIETSKELV